MNKDFVSEIKRYINAGFPAIYLYGYEDLKAIEVILDIAKDMGDKKVYTYNTASGLAIKAGEDGNKLKYDKREDFKSALTFITDNIKDSSFIIFEDCHQYFKDDPKTSRGLKNIINMIREDDMPLNIFLLSSVLNIPMEIEKDVVIIDIPLPTTDEIKAIFKGILEHNNILPLRKTLMNRFIDALNGLTENEIKAVISYSIVEEGKLDDGHVDEIKKFKKQIIKKAGSLELVDVKEKPSDIGGLKTLKGWLDDKGKIFENMEQAKEFGVDTPKGCLMVGMPGCGKSLTARITSAIFKIPLLRLDMGRVMGPYLGQSEENIRRVIKLAEAISPSILWIDEIEKGLAGIGSQGSSSEVVTRIFGTILTWMQEKTSQVFIMATSNDISAMPPELLRKGRFDEIFYVDFPKGDGIKNILEIHFKKRMRWGEYTKGLDFTPLIKEIEERKFAGSDLEAVVKDTIERIYLESKPAMDKESDSTVKNGGGKIEPKPDYILSVITDTVKSFKPLGETMKDKIGEMDKKIKELNLINAD